MKIFRHLILPVFSLLSRYCKSACSCSTLPNSWAIVKSAGTAITRFTYYLGSDLPRLSSFCTKRRANTRRRGLGNNCSDFLLSAGWLWDFSYTVGAEFEAKMMRAGVGWACVGSWACFLICLNYFRDNLGLVCSFWAFIVNEERERVLSANT